MTSSDPLPDAAEGTGMTDSHDDAGEAGPSSDAVRDLAAPSDGENSSRPSPGDVRIESAAKALGKALVQAEDNEGYTDWAEWHSCDECQTTGPCPCSGQPYTKPELVEPVLAAADAADRAAGIVRVDIRGEATVERAGNAIVGCPPHSSADVLARAVLSALREAGGQP